MQIIIRHHGFLRSVAGCAEHTIDLAEGANLVDALRQVSRDRAAVGSLLFLRDGTPAPYVKVLLNGERHLDTPEQVRVRPGDCIDLFPMLSGGTEKWMNSQ